MSVSTAMLLGVVQGLTEFLPISSSGHLAVAQHFLPAFHQPGVLFDIILHLGTLLAVLAHFRLETGLLLKGLRMGESGAAGRRLMWMLIVGTLPAVAAGLTVGELVEASFTELRVVGVGLLITGALLLATRWLGRNVGEERALDRVTLTDALTVGLFQSAAMVPGISRSGSTIVAGLARGLSRDAAARFSFLLSVPAIVGAAVYEMPKAHLVPADAAAGYLAGFLTAFIIGYVAITVVLRTLASRRFHFFGYYCLAVGGGVLVYITRTLS